MKTSLFNMKEQQRWSIGRVSSAVAMLMNFKCGCNGKPPKTKNKKNYRVLINRLNSKQHQTEKKSWKEKVLLKLLHHSNLFKAFFLRFLFAII